MSLRARDYFLVVLITLILAVPVEGQLKWKASAVLPPPSVAALKPPQQLPTPATRASAGSVDQAIAYMLRAAELLDKNGMKAEAVQLRTKAITIKDEGRLKTLEAELHRIQTEIAQIKKRISGKKYKAQPTKPTPVQSQIAFAVKVLEIKKSKESAKLIQSIKTSIQNIKDPSSQKTVFAQPHPTIWTAIVDSKGLRKHLDGWGEKAQVKTIAEPTLVTMSGRAASFFSGREIPIVVPQSNNTVAVEYKEVGIRLDFMPTLLADGTVRMEFRPKISRTLEENAVKVGNTKVPGLRNATIDLAANVPKGKALFIGGLKMGDTTLLIAVMPERIRTVARPKPKQAAIPGLPTR